MLKDEYMRTEDQALDVQENEPFTQEETQNEEEDGLCVQCHAREKDFSQSSHSVLCSECRKDFVALRIPMGIRVFLLLVSAAFLLSLYYLPSTISAYKTYIKAERQMAAREYVFAYNSYNHVLQEYSGSVPVALKAADAALSAQYMIELGEVVDNHLTGRMLNDKDYEKAMAFVHILEAYFGTYGEISDIFEQTDKTIPELQAVEYGKAVIEQLTALLSKEGIDKTQVYFNMGLISSDESDQLEYLRLAAEQDSSLTYPYSYYGNALRWAGKVAEAEQVYESALSIHATDALSIRGLSVLRLLEGEKEEALQSIRYAYTIEPYDVYIVDALIIALCENGLRDEAMALMNELIGEGAEFDDMLYEYLDGTLSLHQYYMS